ncbi:MAG: leucine-rich repeat protein [Ruminococcus sp.]|nr:leucine-rich repeat protein [Ruminococcus sp.]
MSKRNSLKTRFARISAALCAFAITAAVPYSSFYRPILPDAAETDEAAEQPFPFLRYSRTYNDWNNSYSVTIEECDKDYIGNLVIPEYIEGAQVTEILFDAFEGCMNLTGIDIPKTVDKIGNRAFADCFSLKTVIVRNDLCMFPASDNVFNSDIRFSADDKFIGTIYSDAESTASEYARNYGLNFSADIPELGVSPESILPYLTYDVESSAVIISKCDKAASGKFMIPQYIEGLPVIEIADSAFEDCAGITEIELPGTIRYIHPGTFRGCSGLRKIDLPESLRYVEQDAFAGCSSLETVIVRNMECEIYNSPETICNTLTPPEYSSMIFYGTIYAPAGSRAEEYAESFHCDFSAEIPESPVYAENAIPYLSYEEVDEYDVRITKCSPDASGRLIIPLTIDGKYVSEIAREAFMDCKNIAEIELPASITLIGSGAFRGCTCLKRIDLGRRIYSIESGTFDECPALETVIIRSEECHIYQDSGTFGSYNAPFTGTIYGIAGSTAQEYAEENNFNFSTEMPDCTHYAVDNQSCLTFENDGYGATLAKCDPSAVGAIVIPKVANGMPVLSLAPNAFEGCQNLTSVEIPESVQLPPQEAFANCESLCTVILPKNIDRLPDNTFSRCVNLKRVNLPDSLEYIDTYAFESCYSLEEITIPEQVKHIMSGTFANCESLKTVELSENVTEISNHAFENCISLESIKLPQNLKTLGYGAFSYCKNLKTVEIPTSLAAIEGAVFERSGINSIVIPDNILTIPRSSFYCCEELEKITILNPYCDIYDSGETICSSSSRNDGAAFNGVICGYDGSTAEKYAEKYGYSFESLGTAPDGVRGDANADGELTIADAVMLEKWLLGSGKLTAPKNVDLCEDGIIDAYDMCLLRKELVADK